MIDDPKLYRVGEVAKAFGVSDRTVERWIQSGEIDTVKIGHTRRIKSESLTGNKKKVGEIPSNSDD